jgi:hypothetical protein
MQPGALTEADIVAATQSLQARKDLVLAKMASLRDIQASLEDCPLLDGNRPLADGLSAYLGHLNTDYGLDVEALDSQIAHNNRALAAYRSSVLLPVFGPSQPRRTRY